MNKLQLTAANALRKLGQDISDARKRRRIPMALLAERAGILAATLSKIEKGVHTVSKRINGFCLCQTSKPLIFRRYHIL